MIPRRENIQYTTETNGDYFYIMSNENAKNNWLYRIPIPSTLSLDDPARQNWEKLLDKMETVIEVTTFLYISLVILYWWKAFKSVLDI